MVFRVFLNVLYIFDDKDTKSENLVSFRIACLLYYNLAARPTISRDVPKAPQTPNMGSFALIVND